MGKIANFVSKYVEKRSVNDPNHWIFRLTERLGSQAGVLVTPAAALQQSAVFACVRVISETIGSLPLKIYKKRLDGGKDEALNHPIYPILHDSDPNPWQTHLEYFETITAHLCLRGNAYSFIQRAQSGRIQSLIPLHPDGITLKISGTSAQPVFVYQYNGQYAGTELQEVGNTFDRQQNFGPDEIWHLKGLSSDGYIGVSPLTMAANAVGLAIAAERHGSKYFSNGAKTSGIAKYPGKLKEDSAKRLKQSLQDSMTGDNLFKLILLEEGLDYQSIGINNVDSQYLETRGFQIEEIARIFRVPSVLIGHPDKTMTYASVEQLLLAFVTHCIRPWAVRIEQSANKYLLGNDKNYFAEFRMEGLLRGDTKSRYESYASALQNEWMTKNEVRALENLNPVADGDAFKNPAINPIAEQGTPNPIKDKT